VSICSRSTVSACPEHMLHSLLVFNCYQCLHVLELVTLVLACMRCRMLQSRLLRVSAHSGTCVLNGVRSHTSW